MEFLLVGLIVLLAAAAAGWRIYRVLTRRAPGCESCDLACDGCTAPCPAKHLQPKPPPHTHSGEEDFTDETTSQDTAS